MKPSSLSASSSTFPRSGRDRELERAIEEENTRRPGAEKPDIPLRKIGVLCETRWVERHTTLADFHVLYTPLLNCFDAVLHSGRYDGKAVTEANGLLSAIVSGKFLVAFHICRFMSRYLYDLSRLLQGTSKDIVVAYDEVKIVTDQLHDVRSKAEEEFHTHTLPRWWRTMERRVFESHVNVDDRPCEPTLGVQQYSRHTSTTCLLSLCS